MLEVLLFGITGIKLFSCVVYLFCFEFLGVLLIDLRVLFWCLELLHLDDFGYGGLILLLVYCVLALSLFFVWVCYSCYSLYFIIVVRCNCRMHLTLLLD